MEFNELPKDITFDIFSRLPLKTLYKLRCVCKKWQILLHFNHEFKSFYHKKHKISPILLFNKQNPENQSTQLSSYYIDSTQIHQLSTNFPQILTSILTSNGILCLISKSQVVLYDPIIKRVTNLPNSPHFNSSYSWAFGFNPSRNEFKLIHFFIVAKFDNYHYCEVKKIMCEIVSCPGSEIGSNTWKNWRNLGKCPFQILGRKDYAQVDQTLFWLIGEKIFNPDCVKIMSFDLEIEIFGLVIFPKKYSNRSIECLNLVEICGHLCLIDRLPWDSTINVWMMIKFDEGFPNLWEKKYQINLQGLLHHDVSILGHLITNNTNYNINNNNNNNSDNNNNSVNNGDDGEIMMKIGEKSYGKYEIKSQVFKDLGDEINVQQGWNLQLMIDRKLLL